MKHVLSLDVLQLMALSYPARLLKNKLNEDQHISLLLPFFLRLTSSVLGWRDHVIDLEDHLHHLSGKQDLLLLANQGLKAFCSFMSLVPTSLQSIPQCGLLSCKGV
jgi:hypothetical protein